MATTTGKNINVWKRRVGTLYQPTTSELVINESIDEVDPEVDHEEHPKRPIGQARASHRGHSPEVGPQVDPHEAAQPVGVENNDDRSHHQPAGHQADRPCAGEDHDDSEQALSRLVDDVGVGEVLHPLDRLEGGLKWLGNLDEHRRRRREVEHDLFVTAPARDLAVCDRPTDDQGREGDPEYERSSDETRCLVRGDNALADEVVARPEAEDDPEDSGNRPGGHDRAHSRWAERPRDDERPEERHRPGQQLRGREHPDVPPDDVRLVALRYCGDRLVGDVGHRLHGEGRMCLLPQRGGRGR